MVNANQQFWANFGKNLNDALDEKYDITTAKFGKKRLQRCRKIYPSSLNEAYKKETRMNQQKQNKERQKKHEKSAIAESAFLTGTDVIIVPFDASGVLRCKVIEVHTYDLTIDVGEETTQPLPELDCAMALKQQDRAGIQQHLQMHKQTHALALPRPTRRDVVKKGAEIQSFAWLRYPLTLVLSMANKN